MLLSEWEQQDTDCPCFVALKFRQASLQLPSSDPAQDEKSFPKLAVIVPSPSAQWNAHKHTTRLQGPQSLHLFIAAFQKNHPEASVCEQTSLSAVL